VKASSNGEKTEHLEEEKAQEGIGCCRQLTPGDDATDPGEEQSPEGGARTRGPGWATFRQWVRRQRHEGTGRRRGGTASPGGNPLESEPWTWLLGEINQQG